MEMVCRNVPINRGSTLLFLFLLLGTTARGLRPYHFAYHNKGTNNRGQSSMDTMGQEIGMELYPTGSSLPDCAHACGACTPCRRVMVSFSKCSVESCPIVYRCMCKGRYYHVPSN